MPVSHPARAHGSSLYGILSLHSSQPNSNTHTHTHRFILADTEQLHTKIHEMSTRIRELEDALAILQSSGPGGRHPLLSDELLKVKFGPELPGAPLPTPAVTEEKEVQETANALGTMTITDEGSVQYLGRSAGPEALLLVSCRCYQASVYMCASLDINVPRLMKVGLNGTPILILRTRRHTFLPRSRALPIYSP
jgi:hypothetical protein